MRRSEGLESDAIAGGGAAGEINDYGEIVRGDGKAFKLGAGGVQDAQGKAGFGEAGDGEGERNFLAGDGRGDDDIRGGED